MQNARELHSVVTRNMPRGAAEHLLFCRLVDDRLRLTLDHAAWVAKLRFNERAMVRALARDGVRVKQVSWHVAPKEVTRQRISDPGDRARPPGAAAVARLEALAAGFEADDASDPLGRSLRKLAGVLAAKRQAAKKR